MANDQRPERVWIGNAETGAWVSAQYNPEEVTEQLEAVYKGLEVQGLSHEIQQYDHTKSLALSFTLSFDALTATTSELRGALAGGASPDLVRRFLQSLLYPSRGATTVASGAPPKAILVWPKLFSLDVVLTKLVFPPQAVRSVDGEHLVHRRRVVH